MTEALSLATPGDEPRTYFESVAGLLTRLFVRGDLTVAQFDHALERLVGARDLATVEDIVSALPVGVTYTPASQRLGEPLVLSAAMSPLTVGGRWQVAEKTVISAGMAKCRVDFTSARLDSRVIDLRVNAGMSRVELIVPESFQFVMLRVGGRVVFEFERGEVIPGLPLIRLHADAGMGRIVVRRPRPAPLRRRRLRRH